MAKKKSFKSLPKKAQRAAFAEMDDNGTRRKKSGIEVKKLHDSGKNFNPKTKTVVGLPSLPKPTASQIKSRVSGLKKIASQSKGAAALLRSLKKK